MPAGSPRSGLPPAGASEELAGTSHSSRVQAGPSQPTIYPWQEGPLDVRGGTFQRAVSWLLAHTVVVVLIGSALLALVIAWFLHHPGVEEFIWGALAFGAAAIAWRRSRRLPSPVLWSPQAEPCGRLGYTNCRHRHHRPPAPSGVPPPWEPQPSISRVGGRASPSPW